MVKKRESNVELIRIIACVIVIAIHSLRIFDAPKNIVFLFKAFVLNGVPLFWFITGYFMFDSGGGV